MSDQLAWCAKYIGLPYADKGRGPSSFDCWGLVRYVLQQEFGITSLPDYADRYTSAGDRNSVSSAVSAGLALGWHQVTSPASGVLVILRVAGRPWHCGLAISDRLMLHTLEGVNTCVERLDSAVWSKRIEGFYQHVG
jgi:cell wall-associated NlpC family hydrolase